MVLKILMGVTLSLLIILSFFYVYINLPINPTKLSVEKPQDNFTEIISQTTTPMFAENMRFARNNISYFLDDFCSASRVARIENAFRIFNEKTGLVSFYEIDDDEIADILVSCSKEDILVGRNLFAAGEGGPTKFMKIGKFNVIEKGRIHLYKESKCDYPVVELHELFHVFGFDHSDDKKSVMFPVYNCDQRITSDIVITLVELYSIEPLPDAKIKELNAIKKGRYLDFEITVSNEGLSDIKNISLVIMSEKREISRFYLGEINRGYAKTISVANLKMFSTNIKSIDFYVDYENLVRELDKTNNHAQAILN